MVTTYLKLMYCMLSPFNKVLTAGESKFSFSLVWSAAMVVVAFSGRRSQWFRERVCLVRENAGGQRGGN